MIYFFFFPKNFCFCLIISLIPKLISFASISLNSTLFSLNNLPFVLVNSFINFLFSIFLKIIDNHWVALLNKSLRLKYCLNYQQMDF